jgi:hypothetical protein
MHGLEPAWLSDPLLRSLIDDLRRHIRRRRLAADVLKYEGQPRDELGRWTENGGEAVDLSSARRGGIAKKFWGWTARQFISAKCQGWINREFPSQFEHVTIGDIMEIAKGGDKAAQRCLKLLKEGRFRK